MRSRAESLMLGAHMELRHLRYFVAVAEELHFSRAAARLHVAQPAVSEQVRKLEEELGVRLLNRGNGTVSLTEPGAAFLTEARRVLHQVEVTRLAIEHARHRTASHLRIGYSPASLPAGVTMSLRCVAASIPSLETSLEPGFPSELIAAVRDERLDAAIVSQPAATNGLRTTSVGVERAIAALPVGHRQAVESTINLNQAAPERLVVLPRENSPPFYDAVVAACRNAGLSPSLVATPGLCVEPALLAVTAGAGMALLPESVAQRYRAQGVRFVPVEGDDLAVPIAVVTRRETTHTATATFLRANAQAGLHSARPPLESTIAPAA
jgi:DNA-binding transcriptional LysR family regulator